MTDEIYARLPDGTVNPAWAQARAGRITASEIYRVMGDEKVRSTYLLEKLAERVTGELRNSGVTKEMQDGIDQEPEAASTYSRETGEPLILGYLMEGPGFLATPDYLLISGGVLEIKRPVAKTVLGERFGHLLREKAKRTKTSDGLIPVEPGAIEKDYYWQCVAEAIAAGEGWTDLYYYCPELHPVGMRSWCRRVYLETEVERKLLAAVEVANNMLDAAYDAVLKCGAAGVIDRVVPSIRGAQSNEEIDDILHGVACLKLPPAVIEQIEQTARERTMALPLPLG